MMKKVFFAILSTLALANIAYANTATFDDTLFNAGAINSQYKYTNMKKVQQVLKKENESLAKTLPEKFAEYSLEITHIHLTPYHITYQVRMLDETEVPEEYVTLTEDFILEEMSSDDEIVDVVNTFCTVFYRQKYLYANNVQVKVELFNRQYRPMSSIHITKNTCQ